MHHGTSDPHPYFLQISDDPDPRFNAEQYTESTRDILIALLVTISTVVGMVLVANLYTIGNCLQSLFFSHRRHLQRAVAKHDLVKSEGYLQVR